MGPDDFLPHPRLGIDYAWATVSPACHRSIGSTFAIRYHSYDASKDLTPQEAADLQGGGIDVVTLFESSAQRPLDGYAAGVMDAQHALGAARACGCRRVFRCPFAYDEDPNVLDLNRLLPYYEGAGSVLGKANCGGYGGYALVQFLADRGFGFNYQAYAWSAGARDGRAQLYQFHNDYVVCGQGVDLDLAYRADFGQWSYHQTPPTQEDESMIHALQNRDGRLEVFVLDQHTGEVFHAYQESTGGGWAGSKAGTPAQWFSLGKPGA